MTRPMPSRFAVCALLASEPRPKRTCLFRATGLPTSRPYAFEPIAEIATCLQQKRNSFASIHPQARHQRIAARKRRRQPLQRPPYAARTAQQTLHVALGPTRIAPHARYRRDSARGPRMITTFGLPPIR